MTLTELRAAKRTVIGIIGAGILIAETVLTIFIFEWVLGKTW